MAAWTFPWLLRVLPIGLVADAVRVGIALNSGDADQARQPMYLLKTHYALIGDDLVGRFISHRVAACGGALDAPSSPELSVMG